MAVALASVIISIYKNLDALELILKSLDQQVGNIPFEVILAEDNDSEQVKIFVEKQRSLHPYTIKHVFHEDKGFRKCKILNQAINRSNTDYLIFIDGDCILHAHFLEQHLKYRKIKRVVYGRRVMLSEALTHKVLAEKNLHYLNVFDLFRYGCTRMDAALYLPCLPEKQKIEQSFWGCNWSIHKQDIALVKGFDEAYEQAGIGEDTDIAWRLCELKVHAFKIKHKAIQYHLHHPIHYTDTKSVEAILAAKKAAYKQTNDINYLMGNL